MKVEQLTWNETGGWTGTGGLDTAQLVFLFGGRRALASHDWRDALRRSYPRARLFGCSTAGEIAGTRVYEDTIVATAVHFERTELRITETQIEAPGDSYAAGQRLTEGLDPERLVHLLVVSDGQHVNGSELVRGMVDTLPEHVKVTGGLAGDGDRFERTLVFAGDVPAEKNIAALALYSDALRVGFGSLGGWDPFGPERLITRSLGNVLYELDGRPALELYKLYLGEHAAGLPATGLLFPLAIRRGGDSDEILVRTILSVDEQTQSLTFAGDVPEGTVARLMKANFERLIDGASGAARTTHQALGQATPDLALLISCVGRRLVLRQRTEEEVEQVRDVLGHETVLTGFYSYGEICPGPIHDGGSSCELHNQTMTITTFREEG